MNRGRLPARNVSNMTRLKVAGKKLSEADLPIDKMEPLKIVIAPEGSMIHGCNAEAIKDIDGEYLYVWGKVTYTDGFGIPRWIKFCHRYPWAKARDSLNDEGKAIRPDFARYHESGNGADNGA